MEKKIVRGDLKGTFRVGTDGICSPIGYRDKKEEKPEYNPE